MVKIATPKHKYTFISKETFNAFTKSRQIETPPKATSKLIKLK